MKTPEEIKKGLECCGGDCFNGNEYCPYDKDDLRENISCIQWLAKDALAYIEELEQRLAQAERERDAMLLDMQRYSMCGACKHFVDGKKCPMYDDCDYAKVGRFVWRGICAENTKDDAVV